MYSDAHDDMQDQLYNKILASDPDPGRMKHDYGVKIMTFISENGAVTPILLFDDSQTYSKPEGYDAQHSLEEGQDSEGDGYAMLKQQTPTSPSMGLDLPRPRRYACCQASIHATSTR